MQGQSLPFPSWSKDDAARNGNSVLIDQFLREAVQILRHVDSMASINEEELDNALEKSADNHDNISSNNSMDNNSDDEDDDAIVWQLNLTPTMMTLDTSILTVSGLEKVLELIRINVHPQPPKLEDTSQRRLLTISTSYDVPSLRQTMTSILQLSAKCSNAPSADQQHFTQYNAMQLMRHCVQSFIDCGYSFFLDVPSLVANTEMILSQPGAAKGHTVETLLILSICTVMVRHTMLHHRGDMSVANTLMYSYYRQAQQLLQELFDVQHISVLQSMYLLSLFPKEHIHLVSPNQLPSALLTMATRMATAMDLHKLDIQNTKESDQKEKLRRLAWMLLCADYNAQWNALGHTGVIDISQWHVNFPQPLPGENVARRVEFFSQYCRVIVIRKLDLFKSAYIYTLHSYSQKKDTETTGFDPPLFEAYFNTPDTFKLDLSNINQAWDDKSYLESLLLHELYCHTQLFAQLPFLPAKYFDTFLETDQLATRTDLQHIAQQFKPTTTIQTTNLATTHPATPNLTTPSLQHTPHSTPASLSKSLIMNRPELELHCILDILAVTNDYTLILEALALVDTLGCFHSPVYGMLLTAYIYLTIDATVVDIPEINMLCHINLARTQRILQQTKSVCADPVLYCIERLLARHALQQAQPLSATEDDISRASTDALHRKAHGLMQSIQTNKAMLLRQWKSCQL